MESALIFNIQRFSVHDGPGIRTTVFFGGCPLRCFWCHNPEGLDFKPRLQFYPELCLGCGRCAAVCPSGATRIEGGRVSFDRELCERCGACAGECFSGARSLAGTPMDLESVLAEVLVDRPFYEKSGGGVTLSGGEPLSQAAFCEELLRALKAEGVHTAVETSGFVPREAVERQMPWLDLVMMDIKLMDEERHRHAVGVPNARILDNARFLAASGLPMILRTPVVPGVNDDEGEIGAIALFVRELRRLRRSAGGAGGAGGAAPEETIRYELLPFHPMAGDKYRSLDMDNKSAGLGFMGGRRMDELRARAEEVLRCVAEEDGR